MALRVTQSVTQHALRTLHIPLPVTCRWQHTAAAGGASSSNNNNSNSNKSSSTCSGKNSSADASAKHDSQTLPHECWDCHKRLTRSAVMCKGCKRIQPLYDEAKYFDILLPESMRPDERTWRYDVDLGNVRKNYLKLQQLVHPDAWSQSTDTERVFSEQQSSFVNKAYATYATPLARSMYLLEQHNVPLAENEKAQDQMLLMSIVEYQEEIEDLEPKVLQDLGGDKEKCEEYVRIRSDVDEHVNRVERQLADAWERKDLKMCKDLTIQLKYWSNLKTMIHNWVPGSPLRVEH